MVDIDDVVMQAARVHLRGICGDALDEYEGDNYQVTLIKSVIFCCLQKRKFLLNLKNSKCFCQHPVNRKLTKLFEL